MSARINRRELILAGAASPMAARGQQANVPVIGFLNGASAWEYAQEAEVFREGLSETGFVEGRNVLFEYRWADGHYERLPILAADLVRRRVAVIAAGSTAAAVAAKAATTAIPIVFTIAADPIAAGLVTSFSRPEANLTGTTGLGVEVGPKRLELMHQVVPTDRLIALLINPTNPNFERQSRTFQDAANVLGRQLHVLQASSERDFDPVFSKLVQLQAGALVIEADAFFTSRSEQLGALTLRYAVPAIYHSRAFAMAGGLMSYGSSITETYRLVGRYTGRILKGEKPADLPVQLATKVELIINMKTASALGIRFPVTLLGRADEVIE
jgi:putative ABC transport system substrate-binding protein